MLHAAEPHWPGPSNVTLKKKIGSGGGAVISEFQKSSKKSTKKSLHSDSPEVTFYYIYFILFCLSLIFELFESM